MNECYEATNTLFETVVFLEVEGNCERPMIHYLKSTIVEGVLRLFTTIYAFCLNRTGSLLKEKLSYSDHIRGAGHHISSSFVFQIYHEKERLFSFWTQSVSFKIGCVSL